MELNLLAARSLPQLSGLSWMESRGELSTASRSVAHCNRQLPLRSKIRPTPRSSTGYESLLNARCMWGGTCPDFSRRRRGLGRKKHRAGLL